MPGQTAYHGVFDGDGATTVGTYLVLQDILYAKDREWLIDVTDDTNSGSYDAALLQDLAERAEALVNFKIGHRYSVPVDLVAATTTVRGTVKRWTLAILMFLLANRRDRLDKAIVDDHGMTLAELDRVESGDLSIPGLGLVDGSLPESNYRRDNTQPIFSLTRYDKDGNVIDNDESGTLDAP